MASTQTVTLFLCGDVMTGRGIDQRLPHPSDPVLYEPWVKDSRTYVELAEEASGAIPRPMEFSYPWGDALAELERAAPVARVINLETAVTTNDEPWPDKRIHYRMHPANVPVLAAAGVDCCNLANNHVMDWGRRSLIETLEALERAGIATAGAGRDRRAAEQPAALPVRGGEGRVLVFGLGAGSSGIPEEWAAAENAPGVVLLHEGLPLSAPYLAELVESHRRSSDLVVASIHWGDNWGYTIPAEQRELAHRLIDDAGVDLVHGHSSHHVKGIEVHRGKLILYGCGDFLTDYEGITGNERFRGELSLMYFPTVEVPGGRLSALEMVPMRVRRFQLHRASMEETRWLAGVLEREGEKLGTRVETDTEGRLQLRWS